MIAKIYVNRNVYGERWKRWLQKLNKDIRRKARILSDWNAYLHLLGKTRKEDTRMKIMKDCMIEVK